MKTGMLENFQGRGLEYEEMVKEESSYRAYIKIEGIINRIWKNCCCRVVNILLLFILEEEQTGNLDSSSHRNFEEFTRKGVEYEKMFKEERRNTAIYI